MATLQFNPGKSLPIRDSAQKNFNETLLNSQNIRDLYLVNHANPDALVGAFINFLKLGEKIKKDEEARIAEEKLKHRLAILEVSRELSRDLVSLVGDYSNNTTQNLEDIHQNFIVDLNNRSVKRKENSPLYLDTFHAKNSILQHYDRLMTLAPKIPSSHKHVQTFAESFLFKESLPLNMLVIFSKISALSYYSFRDPTYIQREKLKQKLVQKVFLYCDRLEATRIRLKYAFDPRRITYSDPDSQTINTLEKIILNRHKKLDGEKTEANTLFMRAKRKSERWQKASSLRPPQLEMFASLIASFLPKQALEVPMDTTSPTVPQANTNATTQNTTNVTTQANKVIKKIKPREVYILGILKKQQNEIIKNQEKVNREYIVRLNKDAARLEAQNAGVTRMCNFTLEGLTVKVAEFLYTYKTPIELSEAERLNQYPWPNYALIDEENEVQKKIFKKVNSVLNPPQVDYRYIKILLDTHFEKFMEKHSFQLRYQAKVVTKIAIDKESNKPTTIEELNLSIQLLKIKPTDIRYVINQIEREVNLLMNHKYKVHFKFETHEGMPIKAKLKFWSDKFGS